MVVVVVTEVVVRIVVVVTVVVSPYTSLTLSLGSVREEDRVRDRDRVSRGYSKYGEVG